MKGVIVGELMISDDAGFACSKSRLVESGLCHLRPFNISDEGRLDLGQVYYVSPDEAPRGKSALERGDILFNNTNSAELVGKSALVPERMEAGFSNHMTRIRLDQSRIDPAFFQYWLRRLRATGLFTAQATRWVSQAGYKSSELRKLAIDLPPMNEQRRIVDILSRAEGIVRLRREAEKKAAELIPALFIDMFGDPATNPKGWPMRTVGDVTAYTRYGPRFPDRPYADGGAHILRTTDMGYAGELRWQEAPTLPVTDEELEKYCLKPGTLLVTRTGATIGKTALFAGATRPCIAGAYLIEIGLGDEVTPEFILHYLLSSFGQSRLIGGSRAVAQPNVNAPTILAIPMPLPPANLQRVFSERVVEISSIKLQLATATHKAQDAFDALLARAFSAGHHEGRTA